MEDVEDADIFLLECEVNGAQVSHAVPARLLLVHLLRERLQLTGTHVGCDTSQCGACTVLVDGKAVKSCTMLALQADGRRLTTIEGLDAEGKHPVQLAFQECHALQCGFCTPGMIMASVGLLQDNKDPDEHAIAEGLEGNLCRCTGYRPIIEAVRQAAGTMRGRGAAS